MIQDKINNALTAITFLTQQDPGWKEQGRRYPLKKREEAMAKDVYSEAFDQAQIDNLNKEAFNAGAEVEDQDLGELKRKQTKALNYEKFLNANSDIFPKEIESYENSKDEGMFADLSHVYDREIARRKQREMDNQKQGASELAKMKEAKRLREIKTANTEAFAEWVKSAGERGKNPYGKT